MIRIDAVEPELPDDLREVQAWLDFESVPTRARMPGVGDTVTDFRIERERGRGASSVVFEAWQESVQRRVALKIIHDGPRSVEPARLRRVRREARLLASVHHPSLCRVYGAGIEPGFHWVAMELVDGRTLTSLMTDDPRLRRSHAGRLPIILAILRQVAAALAAAHRAGITHRDVKPDNVVVDEHDRPFLVDFGLARAVSPDVSATLGFVGTPRYAAPELLSGAAATPRSDVFAFGALAYELVTGRHAFAGDNAFEVAERLRLRDVAWSRDACPPRDLRAVIERCLQKEPRHRYADAGEVAEEIERILRFEPVRAAPPSLMVRWLRRVQRRPGQATAGLVVLTLAAVATWAATEAARQSSSVERLEGQRRIVDARAAFAEGRIDDAIRRVRDVGPTLDVDAAGLLGDAYLELDAPRDARHWFTRAVELGSVEVADVAGAALGDEAPTATPTHARDHAVTAHGLRLSGDTNAAIAAMDRAIDLDPVHWPWRVRRARWLLSCGRYREAADELWFAHHRRPDDVATILLLSRSLISGEHYDEADRALSAALHRAPHHPDLMAERAYWRLRAQPRRFDAEALRLAAAAIEQRPHDPRFANIYALALCRTDSWDSALRVLNESLAVHPAAPRALHRLGWWYLEQSARAPDNPARAEALAREVIAAEDGDGWAARAGRRLLVLILNKAGRTGEAVDVYRELLALEPESPSLQAEAGLVLSNFTEYPDAEDALLRALGRDPQDQQSLRALGMWRRDRRDLTGALFAYERLIGLNPDSPELAFEMAKLWTRLDDPEFVYMDRALELNPGWMYLWMVRGRRLLARERYVEAEASYCAAMQIADNPVARVGLAKACTALDRELEAMEHVEQALALSPDSWQAAYEAGRFLLSAKDPRVRDRERAVELLERALDLDIEGQAHDRILAALIAAGDAAPR